MRHHTRFFICIIIFFIIEPCICFSCFIIELESNKQFTTTKYWEEKNQIRFYLLDGIIGIPKDSIKRIIPCETAPHSMGLNIEPEKGHNKVPPPVLPNTPKPSPPKKHPISSAEKNTILAEKARLISAYQKAVKAFQATKTNGDARAIEQKRIELLKSKSKIGSLRNQVQKKHDGQLPEWWNESLVK